MKTGKLLWWDKNDQNGIIEDFVGSRFYFDSSVVEPATMKLLKAGAILYFEVNTSIRNSPCAFCVRHLPLESKSTSPKKQAKQSRVNA